MPRFDRYLLSQLTVFFGFFSLVLVSIYWVNRAVALFETLIGGGQSAGVFLEFTALTLPNVIRLVLPVSGFAAVVYAVNRLTSESELVVMQAMGLGPFRLARPVLIFGLGVAVLTGILTHILVPASRAQLANRQAEIAENITAGLDSVLAAQREAFQACQAAREAGDPACSFQFDASTLITPELLIAFAALGVVALIPAIVKKFKKAPAGSE